MTKLLQEADCGREAAIVKFVDYQVAAQLRELDGIEEASLPRCEIRYEQKVIVDTVTAEALIA